MMTATHRDTLQHAAMYCNTCTYERVVLQAELDGESSDEDDFNLPPLDLKLSSAGHVCCSVLQCVALCRSVWHCIAQCDVLLQCAAVCCRPLASEPCQQVKCVAVRCSALQCVVVCCGLLQSVVVCCSALLPFGLQTSLWGGFS